VPGGCAGRTGPGRGGGSPHAGRRCALPSGSSRPQPRRPQRGPRRAAPLGAARGDGAAAGHAVRLRPAAAREHERRGLAGLRSGSRAAVALHHIDQTRSRSPAFGKLVTPRPWRRRPGGRRRRPAPAPPSANGYALKSKASPPERPRRSARLNRHTRRGSGRAARRPRLSGRLAGGAGRRPLPADYRRASHRATSASRPASEPYPSPARPRIARTASGGRRDHTAHRAREPLSVCSTDRVLSTPPPILPAGGRLTLRC
jgi:hypothetical protein